VMNPSTSIDRWRASLRDVCMQPTTRSALVVLFAAGFPFVILWPTTASLLALWSDPSRVELSHGHLTLAIVAWLIWLRRGDLPQFRAQPLAMGALLVVGFIWLISLRASIQIAHQMVLPLISALSICAVCGWAAARHMAIPIGYLYLAMPIWTLLNTPLQWGSVWAVRAFLRVLGIPAYFSGTTIEVSAGVFEIADGCSGLRLMLVGLAIAVLYGEVQRANLRTRLLLVMVAAVLSAFANWLRILIIIGAGHFFGIDHPLVDDHIWFGWAVFAVVMVFFFFVANRLPLGDSPTTRLETQSALPSLRASVVSLFLAASMLAVAPIWSAMQPALGLTTELKMHQPTDSHWQPRSEFAEWRPLYRGADAEWRAVFTGGPEHVEVFSAGYAVQAQGKELIGFGNTAFGDAPVRVTRATTPSDATYRAHIVQTWDRTQWLYWESYRVGSLWSAKPLSVQLQYGWTSLWRIPDAQVLILRARCQESECATAAVALQSAWRAVREMSEEMTNE
jgi:exosortase